MDIHLLLALVIVTVRGHLHGVQGPVFLQEPPSTLTFSNTTGSQVSCSAHGLPTPQVDWLLYDGSAVTAVPGLRQSLGNGTLYFPPFRAQDYRKDVHSTLYRCRASNLVGTIISRNVNIRAIIRQHYEVQVYRAHVLAGNTAVLSCVIPPYVKDYVTVTSWFRDDSILLPSRTDMGGRYIMTSGTSELHIRSARPEDGLARYSCLTLHSLTQERKRSAPAILTVTEATGSMPPRLISPTMTTMTSEISSDIYLTCSAQGNPPPTFTWFRETDGQLVNVLPSVRVIPMQDILYIRRVEPEDSGRWSCKASNQFGDQRLDIHLTITAHLDVHVIPQLQVANSGENAIFNCTVVGFPIGSVQWLRNGRPLFSGDGDVTTIVESNGGRVRRLSLLAIVVSAVSRHDRGMYQCIVRNDRESAQGSAELRLGDTIPEMQYTFIEQALRPGPQVSLRCSATGSPPPQFKWLLDGEALSELTAGHRYAIGQYVDQTGDVISHLNISNIRVEDGGSYSCKAINSLGFGIHSARLNIYGPPFIRSISPVQAVAGTDANLHCPYSGYPISSVRWERRGQQLPADLRHRIDDSNAGSLIINRLDPATDSGGYTCIVTSRNGEMVRRDLQLIIHSPPVLEPFSFPTSLQEGGRAQVTCSVTSGDMPIHFTWYKDNAPVSALLQIEERVAEFFSMLIFKEVTSRHSGSYTCIARNNAARANYTAQLMVKVTPQWIVEPQDESTLLGNAIMVNCNAKGHPQPQITWLKGQGKSSMDYQQLQNMNNRISLLVNGSLKIDIVAPQDEGYYLCRAANGIGAGLTKVIYIGVNEPVRFDNVAKNVSSKRGDPAILICQVYGDSPIQMIWLHNSNIIDSNDYRYTIADTKLENGLKSQLSIGRTDREDSGVYRCQAENGYGRSEHIINFAVQERPDSPGKLEVVEVGGRTVRLVWKCPFNGNSPVLAYLVQYQPIAAEHDPFNITLPISSIQRISDGIEQKEMTIVKGLMPATAYTIRMSAVNNIDQSPFTDPVVVKTQEEAPLEAPQNLQVKSIGQGELFVSWQIPARETWNGQLLGYIITWNEKDTSINNSKSITVKGWATTKIQLTGLKKFTRYEITVRAYNGVSVGPLSLAVIGTTQEGVPEAPPQHVECTHMTSQSMKIVWVPPPASQHGGIIQGYKVFYRPITVETTPISTAGEVKRTMSTETYLHGLQMYTNYSVRVLAYTNTGDGVLSSVLYCNTDEDVPGPPANIKASALTGESILVSWLPPLKPNGRINIYIVYAREAGKVGQHISHIIRTDAHNDEFNIDFEHANADKIDGAINNLFGFTFKVRNLKEHQLYEFWVSAKTVVGEGEPTPIITQITTVKAPSRIASFSQVIAKPVKSSIILPCVVVGNPTSKTQWSHRDKSITSSPFYTVTPYGHLNIHSVDQMVIGNYTCSVKNFYGEDEITYTLVVLLPPSQPVLEVQYTTTNSVRLRWKHSDDGGTNIQGYILSSRKGTGNWINLELSPETTYYTYEDLDCGSMYYIYLTAHNRVGNSSPSNIMMVNTKGGRPHIAKDVDLISTNSTTLQINLFTWPDGGCPISKFSVEYKILSEDKWILVSNSISEERLYIQQLMSATWYQLRVSVQNDAGFVNAVYNFATTTTSGDKIQFPLIFSNASNSSGYSYANAYVVIPLICILIIVACVGLATYILIRIKKNIYTQEETSDAPEEPSNEKIVERDNRKNCQQVYTSSPMNAAGQKIATDNGSDMYEISPYATFNVSGNSRSVTTSTLDYTVQFKTFGHLENDEHNVIIYPKSSEKCSWHKHHYYTDDDNRSRQHNQQHQRKSSRGDRLGRSIESESEDTSESPCNECSGSGGTNYRVPVKPSRGDIFRLDSSTESNDQSPVTERRQTPRHVVVKGIRPEHHRPSSSSSFEMDDIDDKNCNAATIRITDDTRSYTSSNLHLQPPLGFSDSRELSEAECDRDTNCSRINATEKLPVELTTLLARYQKKKDQDRKQFTIHV